MATLIKPTLTPNPQDKPSKYGNDPVQFDAAMQATIDWQHDHWYDDQKAALDYVEAAMAETAGKVEAGAQSATLADQHRAAAATQAGIAAEKANAAAGSATMADQYRVAAADQASIARLHKVAAEAAAVQSAAAEAGASAAKTAAETARAAAVVAQNNAAAVVTGGTATLTPAAGKIPLADAAALIDPKWLTPTALVEQTDIGTDPNQIPLNQYLGGMAFQNSEAVQISGGVITAQIRRRAPVTKTAAFTVASEEHWIICNGTAAIAVTLPDAATNLGREIMLKTIAAFAVNSATSNVVPLAGGAAGTAILPATAGKWATLVSDGTNWIIMQAA